MAYSNYRCPVCEKHFGRDDDVVVCPECGAPHHRECYETLDHCFFEDKHTSDFDFKTYSKQQSQSSNYENNNNQNPQQGEFIACPNCGTFNVVPNDFCQTCGAELNKTTAHESYDRHSEEAQTPPNNDQNAGKPFTASYVFDPMGGLKPEDDLGEGVTVDEVSKFTKNNSPFFCRLFHQIKTQDRSRFSFVGFLFSGGWLLYRKMYKLGTFITILLALMMISQLYIETFYHNLLTNLLTATEGGNYLSQVETIKNSYMSLGLEDKLIFTLYTLSSVGQIALRIICAICGNRWYYNHSIKTISKIKRNSGTKEEAEQAIQSKGGVNHPLAICLIVSYAILSFLPYIF